MDSNSPLFSEDLKTLFSVLFLKQILKQFKNKNVFSEFARLFAFANKHVKMSFCSVDEHGNVDPNFLEITLPQVHAEQDDMLKFVKDKFNKNIKFVEQFDACAIQLKTLFLNFLDIEHLRGQCPRPNAKTK